MKTLLDDEIQKMLRSKNIISMTEVVYKFGDLLVVEDTISGNKRNIQYDSIITESNKKVLKG